MLPAPVSIPDPGQWPGPGSHYGFPTMTVQHDKRTFLRAMTMTAVAATSTLGARAALAAAAVEPVSTGADAEAKPAAAVVQIDKLKYLTPEVKIKAGESVTWTNLEVMPHNVHFVAGKIGADKDLMGAMLTKGQSYTVKFNQAGSYDYHCTPHPFMRAKVVVS